MRVLLLAMAVCIGLAGCSSKEDIAKAEAAVDQFHKELNASEFDKIYDESSDGMKANASQEKLTKLLSAVHRKLGAFQSGKSTGWKVTAGTSGTIVTLGYTTTYERGEANETFIFKVVADKALLQGYNVNSNDLIEN